MRFKPAYLSGYVVFRSISQAVFRMTAAGRENIPATGGFIIASNHISYYDPPLLGCYLRRELYFFAKRELFGTPVFGSAIRAANALPVKRGVVDRQALNLAVEAIESGFGLVMFPEGTRSKTNEFLPPRPGVGMIAMRAGCPVVPAYLHGTNRLGDCFWGREKMSVTYGQPLEADWIKSLPTEKTSYLTIASEVMQRIATIKKQVTSLK